MEGGRARRGRLPFAPSGEVLPEGSECIFREGRVSSILQPSPMDSHEFLRAHLPLIEQIVARVCRRSRLFGADQEDFALTVGEAGAHRKRLRAAARRHAASSFAAFYPVVIQRMAVDERARAFGRWQPSSVGPPPRRDRRHGRDVAATRPAQRGRGPAAAACDFDSSLTRERLEQLAARLPRRTARPREVELDPIAAGALHSSQSADDRALAGDRDRAAGRASSVVREQLDAWPLEDRMLLRFRFASSMSIADISRILRLPQRPLYRRLESLLSRLRRALGDAGLDEVTVSELIGSPVEMQFGFAEAEKAHASAVEDGGAIE